jgi:uncharacterized membrane protein YfcA
MSGLEVLALVCAGLGSGLAGSIAGLASLVSYPALLATGLGPVEANVTNTVALVFSSIGSTLGSRVELRGQRRLVGRLAAAAVAGGAVGAGLLLITPPETFEKIAPWFIGAAAVAILTRRGSADPAATRHRSRRARHGMTAGVFGVGIYGGYFGAAAGVVLLALLLAVTRDTLARANALKNVVLGIANATAALAFCLLAPVQWAALAPLAAGLLVGGRLGPAVVRRADAQALKTLIGMAGLAVAVALGIEAYG